MGPSFKKKIETVFYYSHQLIEGLIIDLFDSKYTFTCKLKLNFSKTTVHCTSSVILAFNENVRKVD